MVKTKEEETERLHQHRSNIRFSGYVDCAPARTAPVKHSNSGSVAVPQKPSAEAAGKKKEPIEMEIICSALKHAAAML
ncbi:hypothetical protein [Paenibacillus polymyxa]|uniref:hypothetical protein n=1 Tax=Paenibacillus polymyxa TaxID=1406 RepID=UPI002AB504E8|nr:hypothetical protein [Paenibacillus polymyxa]MDY8026267.1 hypothetical protein [Paenibacillus polymyxa]